MKIRLRMFAILRERSGISEAEIELAEGATVAVAMEEVGRRFREDRRLAATQRGGGESGVCGGEGSVARWG